MTTGSRKERTVAALCVSGRSIYKHLAGVLAYDRAKDARTFPGGMPVIAHPPCRCWSKHRRLLFAPPDGLAPMPFRLCFRNNSMRRPESQRSRTTSALAQWLVRTARATWYGHGCQTDRSIGLAWEKLIGAKRAADLVHEFMPRHLAPCQKPGPPIDRFGTAPTLAAVEAELPFSPMSA